VVEIDYSVVRPNSLLQIFPGEQLTGPFEKSGQFAELADARIGLERSETNLFYRNRVLAGHGFMRRKWKAHRTRGVCEPLTWIPGSVLRHPGPPTAIRNRSEFIMRAR
jgi:hypothetical protein